MKNNTACHPKSQQWRPGTSGDKPQQESFLLFRKLAGDIRKHIYDGMTIRVASCKRPITTEANIIVISSSLVNYGLDKYIKLIIVIIDLSIGYVLSVIE